jgi:hypothetical protein
MNHEEIGTLIETVDGADLNAIGVFALDAVVYNNKSHGGVSGISRSSLMARSLAVFAFWYRAMENFAEVGNMFAALNANMSHLRNH